MDDNRVSITALVTAFGRAYHSRMESPKIFDDFLAYPLLSKAEYDGIANHLIDGIQFYNPQQAHSFPDRESALSWVVQTQLASISISRSRYAEDVLENAVRLGATQYVILGAGFDTFAFRRPDLLARLRVFEVDHPATQAEKLRRIQNAGWQIDPRLHFAPVDFSKNDFAGALLRASYDPTQLTFFSWLGVTYYLAREDVLATLKTIARVAPKGSALVFDYTDQDFFDRQKASQQAQKMQETVRNAGEPMKNGYQYSELEADLEEAGFLLFEHLAPPDIQQRYFRGRSDLYRASENIHFALAVVNG